MSDKIEDTFRTIEKQADSLFKDRGSKFFGYVFPMKSEEDFKSAMETIKTEHHQARHHCFAYRFDPDDLKYRANDDGEPSHSAGTPILHALQSAELINVGAIVVRYFGGTKLGVSGLINAYRTAAEMAINSASIIVRELEYSAKITTDYAHLSQVLYQLEQHEARIEQRKMEYDCEFEFSVRRANYESLKINIETLENVKFVGEF
ncbi:IMPACT family protein [Phaeocystidibacter luteus]|uniref:YigZ family protein n=1 Tax=Phaeocystidibacter luteus TaxID=911197 RepID=A0A6N6RLN4_9FLAO|nr:YigZ family protein [Phaeocystidibacter luteus]KAB2814485.1 YigZ family protein [Phaeocystidibacter luteus]